MEYVKYEEWSPQEDTIETLKQAKEVIISYAEQGHDLTLRQLYYQLVSRNYIPNEEAAYNRLGRIVSRGRKAGMLPWDVITDKERSLRYLPNYEDPSEIVRQSAGRFYVDLWEDQVCRPEILVEKKALESVVRTPANRLDVDYAACKGYISDTFAWQMARRHRRYEEDGQMPVVIHLGDHDPSGINMTEDIRQRLHLYGAHTKVERVALNMDQIEEHDPPPQPAKVSDSRYEEYVKNYGDESWELDALPPDLLQEIVRDAVEKHRNDERWQERKELQEEYKEKLRSLSDQWDEIEPQLD